jgi:hypothetical protein
VIARAAASVVLAGALLLGTAGCGLVATIATQIPYTPSDGVSVSSGSITVLNVLGLSEDGTDVSLVFTAANSSNVDVAFTMQYEVDGQKFSTRITVPARSTVSYGNEGEEQLVLRDVGVTVGSLFPVYVQSDDQPGAVAMVPILDGAFGEYSGLLPTPLPTPVATETAVPEPTETPAP